LIVVGQTAGDFALAGDVASPAHPPSAAAANRADRSTRKPAGRGLADHMLEEVSQDTWIVLPWEQN